MDGDHDEEEFREKEILTLDGADQPILAHTGRQASISLRISSKLNAPTSMNPSAPSDRTPARSLIIKPSAASI